MKVQHGLIIVAALVIGYFVGMKYPNFWKGITG